MYERAAAASGRGRNARFSERSGRHPRREAKSGREQTLLLQLVVCLILFLTVFIGKGVFPSRLLQVRDELLGTLGANTDFRSVLSGLGESLGREGPLLDQLEEFCAEVFGPGGPDRTEAGEGTEAAPAPVLTGLRQEEERFLAGGPEGQALAEHYLRTGETHAALPFAARETVQAQPGPDPEEAAPAAPPEEPAATAAGTVLAYSDYSGDPPPANYTMDRLSLGGLETMTPVLGRINSEYGYRDHPINGRYQVHGGVDISGKMGDPIHAFAAGTVEYVGEDDSYGLYLQVDHGNGVKSFYAHCSKIVVRKGQVVSIGEKVAEIGSTGSATGPHLHLELKYGKTHLNPIYYIDYQGKA